jgi:predicted dehydrogenase
MNYPKGEPDAFDYCLYEGGGDPQWQSLPLAGSWYPHAFIGTMADLMRVANGEIGRHPTAVEDALRTMAVVEAAYASSATGGVPPPRFSEGKES